MTKLNIVKSICNKINYIYPESQVKVIVQNMLDVLTNGLKNGQTIELRNFGTFKVREKKKTTAYNFQTKERMNIKSKRKVIFKLSKKISL